MPSQVGSVSVGIGANISNLLTGINRAVSAVSNFSSRVSRIASSASASFNRVGQSAQQAGQRISEAGSGITDQWGMATAGAVAGVTALTASASRFQYSASKMQAQLGITRQEAQKLEKSARSVWRQGFGSDLDEANNAIVGVKQNMYATGGASQDILQKMTKGALTLSEAFGADVQESTRTAGQLMKTFGVSGQKAMDLITWGFQNNLDFSGEFLDNVNEYSPQFKAMGFSAEEMFSTFKAGAKEGAFNLDKVGDAIKEFNIRIKNGSDTTAGAMEQMSSKTQGLWDKMKSGKATGKEVFDSVVKDLKGMEDQQKANELGVALLGTQWEDLEKDVVQAMGSANGQLKGMKGATELAGKALKDNLKGQFTELWRTAQTALIPLGEALMRIATQIIPPLISGIQKMASWFTNLSPTTQNLIAILLVAGTAFMGIVTAIGAVLGVIGTIVGGIGTLITTFGGMSAIVATVTGGLGAFMSAVGAVILPITLVVGAIAGLIAILVNLYKTNEEFRTKVNQVWDAIKTKITQVTDAVATYLSSVWSRIKNIWTDNQESIKKITSTAWSVIGKVVNTAMDLILGIFQYVYPVLEFIVKGAWNSIKNVINGALNIINGLVKTFSGLLTGDFSKMWSGIKQLFSGAIEFIWGLWNLSFYGRLTKIATSLVKFLYNTFKGSLTSIANFFKSFGTSVWNFIKSAFNGIANTISTIMSSISRVISTVWNAIFKFIGSIVSSIVRVFSSFGTSIWNVVTSAFRGLSSFIGSVMNSIYNIIASVWRSVSSVVSSALSGIGRIISSVFSNAVSIVKSAGSGIYNSAVNAFKGIKSGVSSALSGVGSVVSKTFTTIWNWLANLSFKSIGYNLIHGLTKGIWDAYDYLTRSVTSIANWVKDAFYRLFDIHSPSRFMRYEIGENIMKGWIKGIDGMKTDVLRKTGEMAQWMTPDVPAIETGYSTSGLGGRSMASSAFNKSQTTDQLNEGSGQRVIENVIVLDNKEIARQQQKVLDPMQGEQIQLKTYMKGRKS